MLGTSLLWRSTVAFTYLKVKSAKCLCLLPVVLEDQGLGLVSSGLGLGLKNLVLFTSLNCVLPLSIWGTTRPRIIVQPLSKKSAIFIIMCFQLIVYQCERPQFIAATWHVENSKKWRTPQKKNKKVTISPMQHLANVMCCSSRLISSFVVFPVTSRKKISTVGLRFWQRRRPLMRRSHALLIGR